MCLEKQKHLLWVIMIKQLCCDTERWGIAAGETAPYSPSENITTGLMQWASLEKQSISAPVINGLFVWIHGRVERGSFLSSSSCHTRLMSRLRAWHYWLINKAGNYFWFHLYSHITAFQLISSNFYFSITFINVFNFMANHRCYSLLNPSWSHANLNVTCTRSALQRPNNTVATARLVSNTLFAFWNHKPC